MNGLESWPYTSGPSFKGLWIGGLFLSSISSPLVIKVASTANYFSKRVTRTDHMIGFTGRFGWVVVRRDSIGRIESSST